MPYPYSSTSVNLVADDGPISYASIDLLDNVPVKDQLKVYLDGQLKVYNTDYTIDLTLQEITMTPAVTGTVKVARVTDIENKEVTFTNSSVLTAQDLNKNTDQLLFLAQELYDKAQLISLTPVGSIADDSIGSNLLNKTAGSEAVVTTAIFSEAVTEAKIATGAVTATKIGTDAVIEAKIQDGAVTTNKIADDAVNNDKMSAGAPTWTAGGNVTVSGALTVVGDITGGAAAYPAISATHLITATSVSGTANRSTAPVITGLKTSITTKRNNSKVLVEFNLSYDNDASGAAASGVFILERSPDDTTWTEIGSPADPGSATRYGIKASGYDADTASLSESRITYLDTPGNAGTYYYRLRWDSANTNALRINQTAGTGASAERVTSTCILQEVFQ
jgi:hypothetical protein